MKLLVGLGNPGQAYALTRHNAGFMAVDALAAALGLEWQEQKKSKALVAKSGDLILAKPLTFMNLSGEAVSIILRYYKLPPADLVLIHDDLDVDLGAYKIATRSRAAGHNGVQSIIDRLGTQDFTRYRLGIRTAGRELVPADKFVLQKFPAAELDQLNQAIAAAIEHIKTGLA